MTTGELVRGDQRKYAGSFPKASTTLSLKKSEVLAIAQAAEGEVHPAVRLQALADAGEPRQG